jgi:hypothetical protein
MRRSYLALLLGFAAVALTVPGLSGQSVPSKDVPKDVPKDTPKAAPADVPKAAPKDAPKGSPKDNLRLTAEGFVRFRVQEIDHTLGVGYAVLLTDVNGDGKPDIVVVDTERVLWYENPGVAGLDWKPRTMIENKPGEPKTTKPDNVSIAAYIVGGKLVGFALAAGWKPFDTAAPGTLQWLKPGKTLDEEWSVHPIPCDEPTVHRIRFADLDGDGQPELVVVPLMGRGSTNKRNQATGQPGANWMDGQPVRLLSYKVPADPANGPWEQTVLNENASEKEQLHVVHNFYPLPAEGRKGSDLLTASYEGVGLLSLRPNGRWGWRRLGEGNQNVPQSNRGSSEVKPGQLRGGRRFIATVEPWHGNQVVVYTPAAGAEELWERQVVDSRLRWGHAVWCADLDGDGDDEIIIGVRDNPMRGDDFQKDLRGVRVYKCTDGVGRKWEREMVDTGGVAVEDLAAADLDGDGRIDIVAVGRATGNVRIYWNVK